jgi:hypothetical protein
MSHEPFSSRRRHDRISHADGLSVRARHCWVESAESFELPGADLSGEELSVRVIPKQADEFTCSSCFLVHHRSRLASEKNGVMICTDCAA